MLPSPFLSLGKFACRKARGVGNDRQDALTRCLALCLHGLIFCLLSKALRSLQRCDRAFQHRKGAGLSLTPHIIRAHCIISASLPAEAQIIISVVRIGKFVDNDSFVGLAVTCS